jgi:hypothetical protein
MRDNHANVSTQPEQCGVLGQSQPWKHLRAVLQSGKRLDHMLGQWGPTTRGAAVGNGGYFLLHGDGGTSCSGIPAKMDELVREKEKAGTTVTYAALGCTDEYFVLFDDDSAQWSSHSDLLTGLIKKRHAEGAYVNLLAFALEEGYLVRFDDRSWQYNNLPTRCLTF